MMALGDKAHHRHVDAVFRQHLRRKVRVGDVTQDLVPAPHADHDSTHLVAHPSGEITRRLRQVANLVRDDGEGPPGLARPAGFDGGIERQEVGLAVDLVNVGDALLDLAHIADDIVQHIDHRHRLL